MTQGLDQILSLVQNVAPGKVLWSLRDLPSAALNRINLVVYNFLRGRGKREMFDPQTNAWHSLRVKPREAATSTGCVSRAVCLLLPEAVRYCLREWELQRPLLPQP